jgi:DTW domain-containing protein YfiP
MSFRELCLRCRRAQKVCQCADIRSFESGPIFVILTHPIERRMKTGTGRMAHLCLSNSIYIEGAQFHENERINTLIQDPKYFPIVLYPGKAAVEIQQIAPTHDRRLLIFVIDGTWNLAKTMLNRSPNLAALPQIRFTPTKLSNFQIRKQPNPLCLSTIEAVHHLLETIEPGRQEHSYLLEAFDKMVQRQLEYSKQPSRRHRADLD